MECSEVRLKLDEYINGRLDPVVRESICLHLKDCPRCSQELNYLIEINEILGMEGEKHPGENFTSIVMDLVENDAACRRVGLFKRAPIINFGASLMLTGILVLFLNIPSVSQILNSYASTIKDSASTINSNISAATSEIQSYFINILNSGGKAK